MDRLEIATRIAVALINEPEWSGEGTIPTYQALAPENPDMNWEDQLPIRLAQAATRIADTLIEHHNKPFPLYVAPPEDDAVPVESPEGTDNSGHGDVVHDTVTGAGEDLKLEDAPLEDDLNLVIEDHDNSGEVSSLSASHFPFRQE